MARAFSQTVLRELCLILIFGSYPFLTSSNTVLLQVPAPVWGVVRTVLAKCSVSSRHTLYCVGAGPFPTELFDETGDKMLHWDMNSAL